MKKTQQCFDNYKNAIYTKNRSVCDILKYCTGCKCIYSKLNRKGNHVCGKNIALHARTTNPQAICVIWFETKEKQTLKNQVFKYVF